MRVRFNLLNESFYLTEYECKTKKELIDKLLYLLNATHIVFKLVDNGVFVNLKKVLSVQIEDEEEKGVDNVISR